MFAVGERDRVRFGEVVKTRGYGVHARWGPSGWFTDPALSGGGAPLDMGVHAIDTARFLLADPEPLEVCAVAGTRYAQGRYAVDDDAVLLIRWSNGTNSLVDPAGGTRTFLAAACRRAITGAGSARSLS